MEFNYNLVQKLPVFLVTKTHNCIMENYSIMREMKKEHVEQFQTWFRSSINLAIFYDSTVNPEDYLQVLNSLSTTTIFEYQVFEPMISGTCKVILVEKNNRIFLFNVCKERNFIALIPNPKLTNKEIGVRKQIYVDDIVVEDNPLTKTSNFI